jgi:hypothetical protein
MYCVDQVSFQETRFKARKSAALKSDLEQNTFRNLIFASKANLCQCVQCNTENQESRFSNFQGTFKYQDREIWY